MTLLSFIAAAGICLFVHLGAMAMAAHACGITIRRVSWGFGPTLFTAGVVHVRAIPLAGQVTLKDSRQELLGEHELSDAFDHQPAWKQTGIPLVGNAVLVLLAIPILGSEAWASFIAGFSQVFKGAVSPLDTAQQYLGAFVEFGKHRSFLAVLALIATKFAAFNLLPIPPLNGGQALLACLRLGGPPRRFEDQAARLGVVLMLLLSVSWLVALAALASAGAK